MSISTPRVTIGGIDGDVELVGAGNVLALDAVVVVMVDAEVREAVDLRADAHRGRHPLVERGDALACRSA